MKHAIIIFAVYALATSCSKETATPALIGTWNQTTVEVTTCDDSSTNHPVESCDNYCYTYVFAASTVKVSVLTAQRTDTYTVNGDTMVLTATGGNTNTYQFTVTGTTLTLISSGNSNGCTVKTVYSKSI